MATSLRSLVEEAFADYLIAQAVTTNVYAGVAPGDKAAPCVVCEAVSAEEDPIDTGNFRVLVRITCKGLAADGASAFNQMTDNVNRAIYVSTLPTLLQAQATGLVVIGISTGGALRWEVDQDCWTESFELEAYCSCTR